MIVEQNNSHMEIKNHHNLIIIFQVEVSKFTFAVWYIVLNTISEKMSWWHQRRGPEQVQVLTKQSTVWGHVHCRMQ